jgi:hypothetical protein
LRGLLPRNLVVVVVVLVLVLVLVFFLQQQSL